MPAGARNLAVSARNCQLVQAALIKPGGGNGGNVGEYFSVLMLLFVYLG